MNLPEIIYNSFKKEGAEAKPERTEVTFAPSYLSSCGREIGYKKLGYKPTNPPDLPSLLKMSWGNILHDDIQKRLQDAGILESHEVHRTIEYEGIKFNYFYDGILNIGGERAILEIKTIYGNGFRSVEERPKDEHVLQTLSYMVWEGIDIGCILYAGRDNGYLLQYNLEISSEFEHLLMVNGTDYGHYPAWIEKISKLKDLKAKIEQKELPNREYEIVMKHKDGVITESFQKDKVKYESDYQCNYCGFKDLCWKSEYEQIKKHSFFINGQFS